MSRGLTTQTHFYQNQGGGGPSFVEWFNARHRGQLNDLIRRDKGRAAGLHTPHLPAQTAETLTAFLANPEAMARLETLNLSALPSDEAPISVFDAVAWRSGSGQTATAVGLVMEAYDQASHQPVPLGELDAPDRLVRRLQAAWVTLFDEQLGETANRIYDRNRHDQGRIIALALTAAFAATGFAFVLPMAAAAAPVITLAGAELLDRFNQHRRDLMLKDLATEIETATAFTRAATEQRQEKLIELIQALFNAVGHLREDAAEIELEEKTDGHLRLIFALYGLLRGNRQCSGLHMRAMGMVHQSRGLQWLDQALVRRSKAGEGGTFSFSRIGDRLAWLTGAGLAVGAGLAAGALLGGLDILPAVGCGAAAAVGLVTGWVKTLVLHSRTDRLLSDDKLAEICQEAAFAHVPGPADMPLETGLSRTTRRLWVRLLREEGKRR